MNFDEITAFLTQRNSYLIQAFLAIFIALVVDFIQRRILKRLITKAESSKNLWDDAILKALQRPITVIIWVLGIFMATEIIHQATKAVIFDAMVPMRDTAIILSLAWFLVRAIKGAEKNIVESDRDLDLATVQAISKLLKLSVVITASLVALQTLGFSISGVLAFGGVGGIAVGFAARDLLANFFGGLMIFLDRPFAVGDWIRSPDRDIEGVVENIGWRLTRIRTFDKRPLYLPNAIFTNIAVENPSRMENRRIKETIGIRYDDVDKMATIVEKVKSMLQSHSEIDTQKTLIVNFNSFAPSSLDFFIYTFTKTTDWIRFHEIKQDVLLKVIDIIAAEGAECAFPTSTIHVADLEKLSPQNLPSS